MLQMNALLFRTDARFEAMSKRRNKKEKRRMSSEPGAARTWTSIEKLMTSIRLDKKCELTARFRIEIDVRMSKASKAMALQCHVIWGLCDCQAATASGSYKLDMPTPTGKLLKLCTWLWTDHVYSSCSF